MHNSSALRVRVPAPPSSCHTLQPRPKITHTPAHALSGNRRSNSGKSSQHPMVSRLSFAAPPHRPTLSLCLAKSSASILALTAFCSSLQAHQPRSAPSLLCGCRTLPHSPRRRDTCCSFSPCSYLRTHPELNFKLGPTTFIRTSAPPFLQLIPLQAELAPARGTLESFLSRLYQDGSRLRRAV